MNMRVLNLTCDDGSNVCVNVPRGIQGMIQADYDKMLTDLFNRVKVRSRVVVCAANRYGKTIVCGARHYDNPMRGVVAVLQRDAEEYGDELLEAEQGFVDEHGVFMTRQEAWHVASAAKQVKYRVGGDTADGGTLYSENLY